MIKVLHVVTRIDIGGISTMLLNYCSHMHSDKFSFEIVSIDTHGKQELHDEFLRQGIKVHYMPANLFQRLFYLFNLMAKNKYDIVHSHIELQSAVYLFIACLSGVKVRIAHAHLSHKAEGIKANFYRFLLSWVTSLGFAASDLSMRAVFPTSFSRPLMVLKNAIDVNRYAFDIAIRNRLRAEFNLTDKLVLGFVGRLTYQKNIKFLAEVFIKACTYRKDICLLVAGQGEDGELLTTMLKQAGLEENLIWLKSRTDVHELLQAMDILLLPSFYEGLPLVLVESQASGLMSIVSTAVTRQVKLSSTIHYRDIGESKQSQWVELILELGKGYTRKPEVDSLSSHGFNIEHEADRLQQIYTNLLAHG